MDSKRIIGTYACFEVALKLIPVIGLNIRLQLDEMSYAFDLAG
jgi:hypothetical protein